MMGVGFWAEIPSQTFWEYFPLEKRLVPLGGSLKMVLIVWVLATVVKIICLSCLLFSLSFLLLCTESFNCLGSPSWLWLYVGKVSHLISMMIWGLYL